MRLALLVSLITAILASSLASSRGIAGEAPRPSQPPQIPCWATIEDELKLQFPRLTGRSAGATRSFLSQSPAMQKVFSMIDRVAGTDAIVLIQGESGTGKELVARALHEASLRKDNKFMDVNCGAISSNLLESEFFGHKRGAFTGAVDNRKGYFLEADKGTLFLDEVGELPLDMQAKLLRVLQESRVRPVGEDRDVTFNVRIIAATNKDLRKMVQDGKFREDLFYRLKVVMIHMPALRDRVEDIEPLSLLFFKKFSALHKRNIKVISPAALQALKLYGWPGNVRELANVIESAVILEESDTLQFTNLPEEVQTATLALLTPPTGQLEVLPHGPLVNSREVTIDPEMVATTLLDLSDSSSDTSIASLNEAVEKLILVKLIKKLQWNQSAIAAKMGMTRSTLRKRLITYGLMDSE